MSAQADDQLRAGQATPTLINFLDPEDIIPTACVLHHRRNLDDLDVEYLEYFWSRYYGLPGPLPVRRASAPSALPPQESQGRTSPLLTNGAPTAVDAVSASASWLETARTYGTMLGQACRIALQILRWTWQLTPKTLLLAVLMLVGSFLLLVQIAALIYTPLYHSYMSSFCQWSLPFVRNWMCSSWDDVQFWEGFMSERSIGAPLENILSDELSAITYGLPHGLVRWETIVRSYRAELPESEYSSYDQEYFDTLFTAFVEESQNTTTYSHRFYHHMKGTIKEYLLETKWLIGYLDNAGLFDTGSTVDSLSARLLAQLSSWNIIFLPGGIEPLGHLRINAPLVLDHLQRHSDLMIDRLTKDHDNIINLQTSLRATKETSERIQRALSDRISENNKQSRLHNGYLGILRQPFYGPDISNEIYKLKERKKWLDKMKPVFNATSTYLNKVEREFDSALHVCIQLKVALLAEGKAARYGGPISAWVREYIEKLESGVTDLETEFTKYQSGELRFREDLFNREREGLPEQHTNPTSPPGIQS